MTTAASATITAQPDFLMGWSNNSFVFVPVAQSLSGPTAPVTDAAAPVVRVTRTAAQLSGAPTAADKALGPGATFALDTDNSVEYAISNSGTAFARKSGGGGGGTVFTQTPKSLGAAGNGTTDDAPYFNQGAWYVQDGAYKITSASVTVPANTSLEGPKNAALTTDGQLFGVVLSAGAELRGTTLNTTGGVNVNFLSSNRGQALDGNTITDTSASNSIAVNINDGTVRSARITSNDIISNSYGILTNQSGNVDGLVISSNIIETTTGDAIEINGPIGAGHIHSSIAVNGNVLRGGASGSGTSSGFAFGFAGGRNCAVVGNTIPNSRLAAFHFEDGQQNNTVVGNAAWNLSGPGFWAQQTSGGGSRGIVVAANTFQAAPSSTSAGLYGIFDGTGSVNNMLYIGNRINGFKYGIQTGQADIVAAYNQVENSDVAVNVVASSKVDVIGPTMSSNCPTLMKTVTHTICGPVYSDITPTTIIDTTGKTTAAMGAVIRGFRFPLPQTTFPAMTYTDFPVFAAPDRISGRVILRMFVVSTNNFSYSSMDVLYDGTTVTVSNQIKDIQGTLDIVGIASVVSGQFTIRVYNAHATNAVTCNKIYLDFDGEYYKH